jgi:hypothetical protein
MKKQEAKKLRLSRETLRALQADLQWVAGGLVMVSEVERECASCESGGRPCCGMTMPTKPFTGQSPQN